MQFLSDKDAIIYTQEERPKEFEDEEDDNDNSDDNKELKKFLNTNFNYVIKILKNIDEEEIKNIINSPNLIIEPIKKCIKKKKKEFLKSNPNREEEEKDNYRFNNINNYDFDDNYNTNRFTPRNKLRTFSTKIKNFKNKLRVNKKPQEISVDDFYQKYLYQRDKRNNTVEPNNDVILIKKDKRDYNDNYKDFHLSDEENSTNNELQN